MVDKRTRLAAFDWQTDMHYELTNALPREVTVRLLQSGLWGDTTIPQRARRARAVDADAALWEVKVPAKGKASLSASFQSRY